MKILTGEIILKMRNAPLLLNTFNNGEGQKVREKGYPIKNTSKSSNVHKQMLHNILTMPAINAIKTTTAATKTSSMTTSTNLVIQLMQIKKMLQLQIITSIKKARSNNNIHRKTNKRTARRHVRTHGTEHANRRKTTHEQGGHESTDHGRWTRVKSGQTSRCTSGAPHTSATPKLLRVPPAIDIPLYSAVNHRRIRHHARRL